MPMTLTRQTFSLKSPEAVYVYLTGLIYPIDAPTEPLSIEILSSAYPFPNPAIPILSEPPHIGISRKALIQAFIHARQVFLAVLQSPALSITAAAQFEAFRATSVLLLHDPSHSTALNYRKRYIIDTIRTQATSASVFSSTATHSALDGLQCPPRGLAALFANELWLISSLVTSPLPQHVKSSGLWHHRHWILTIKQTHTDDALLTFVPSSRNVEKLPEGVETNNDKHRAQAGFETYKAHTKSHANAVVNLAELEVVLAAAERHKANYHAFQYARQLFLHSEKSPQSLTVESAVAAVCLTEKWCFKHPSDISGWAFLAFLLRSEQWPSEDADDGRETHLGALTRKVVERANAFVRDIGWSGESVQWFLKAMGDSGPTTDQTSK